MEIRGKKAFLQQCKQLTDGLKQQSPDPTMKEARRCRVLGHTSCSAKMLFTYKLE